MYILSCSSYNQNKDNKNIYTHNVCHLVQRIVTHTIIQYKKHIYSEITSHQLTRCASLISVAGILNHEITKAICALEKAR